MRMKPPNCSQVNFSLGTPGIGTVKKKSQTRTVALVPRVVFYAAEACLVTVRAKEFKNAMEKL